VAPSCGIFFVIIVIIIIITIIIITDDPGLPRTSLLSTKRGIKMAGQPWSSRKQLTIQIIIIIIILEDHHHHHYRHRHHHQPYGHLGLGNAFI